MSRRVILSEAKEPALRSASDVGSL